MADMFSYNGAKLPALPSFPAGCDFGIIFYDKSDSYYYLFCSSEAVSQTSGSYIAISGTATFDGYRAKEGASYWSGASFTPTDDRIPDEYIIASTERIIWSNSDICDKESGAVVYQTTKPLQYPTISLSGGSKTYRIGTQADSLVCNATVNDGGTLSWAWYEGETLVGTESSFTPPTDTLGEKSYYCVVTNTTEGEALSTTSGTVTIQVRDFFPIREWVTWLIAGLCSRPLPIGIPGRTPVAYLYNGVRLPALPEWDMEALPCAAVFDLNDDMYMLILSNLPLLYRTSSYYLSGTSILAYMCIKDPNIASGAGFTANTWAFYHEETLDTIMYMTGVFWRNLDGYDDNGNALAASDPVPVYE